MYVTSGAAAGFKSLDDDEEESPSSDCSKSCSDSSLIIMESVSVEALPAPWPPPALPFARQKFGQFGTEDFVLDVQEKGDWAEVRVVGDVGAAADDGDAFQPGQRHRQRDPHVGAHPQEATRGHQRRDVDGALWLADVARREDAGDVGGRC